jgi:release factor glutamine methyltransferase
MTLREFIKKYINIINKKGIENPLYFVAKLISEIENVNLSNILIEKDFIISEDILNKLKKIILDDYPLEYITNNVVFYNYEFYVDNNVLIPRIETEDLINIAKEIIIKNNYKYIMDIGTGSGVIAIILKKLFPDCTIYGVDISKNALKVAEKNAKIHNVNIKFIQSDIFENVPTNILNNIEFIVSNPPYVEKDFFDKSSALKYEPKIALEAGKDGQDFFYKLSNNYPEFLKTKHFLFETTEFNINKTVEILSEYGVVKVYKDSFGVRRFVEKERENEN